MRGPSSPPPIERTGKYLKVAGIGCGLLLVISLGLGIFVYARLGTFLRYGLHYNISQMEQQLSRQMWMPGVVYEELKIYLKSLNNFVDANPMDRENLTRFRMITRVMEPILNQGTFGRNELMQIRGVMLASRIPLAINPVKAAPVAVATPKPVVRSRPVRGRKK